MADEAGLERKDDLRRRFAKTFVFRLIYRGDPGLQVTSQSTATRVGWKEVGAGGGQVVVSTCCNTTVLGAYRRTNTHKGVHEYVDGRKRRYMSIGPDKVIPMGVFRGGQNHPIQGL